MSFSQHNSSEFSHIMPEEFGEHLIRDQRPFLHTESLQILQIHSSMTVLLLFSSPHSFSIGFRSEDWNGHSRSLVLCSVTHFCVVFEVCVWIIVRLEDPNMAHYKISNRVSHLLIFYMLVFNRIHDAVCLNKMFRTSSRKIGPQHKKYSSIFHCTHGRGVTRHLSHETRRDTRLGSRERDETRFLAFFFFLILNDEIHRENTKCKKCRCILKSAYTL